MATSGRHLDRLTAVDASFLTNESSSSHMHIGAILIFEGPPPKYTDLVEHVRKRLPLVPRFRQKLVVPPLEAALGAVAGAEPGARPLRDPDQDPPRDGRRGLGGRHRHRPLRPRARRQA